MEMYVASLLLLMTFLTSTVHCSEHYSGLFKLKRNTYWNTNVNESITAYSLMRCLFLCLESRLCRCINFKELDGMCQVMFYNPRTGVFPSHLTNATDWTLGCKKSGQNNCQTLKLLGFTANTQYMIDPDGPLEGVDPFVVYCNSMDVPSNQPMMIVNHDTLKRTRVKGYEADGSYKKVIGYTYATIKQLHTLVKMMGGKCQQQIIIECKDAGLWYSWWMNRKGEKRQYWGGKNTGQENVCDSTTPASTCNCMLEDGIWRRDEGNWTDVDDLPVTKLCFGDTGHAGEDLYYTLGKLIC